MEATIIKLEKLLNIGQEYLSNSSDNHLCYKYSKEKWSKKEILGHLIDSGINNLQRFTEVQYGVKPYRIRQYIQDELVKANDYQNSETKEILDFWVAINMRIRSLIKQQDEVTLNYKLELYEGEIITLKYLMIDYVDHMEHHFNQIKLK